MKLTISIFTFLTAFCYWTGELMPKAYSNAPTAMWEVMGTILLSLIILYGIHKSGYYEDGKRI
jgi:hypothetical protein